MLTDKLTTERRAAWSIENTLMCLRELLVHRPRERNDAENEPLRSLAAVGGSDAAVLVDDRGKPVSSTPSRYTVTRELARWYETSPLRGMRAPQVLRADIDDHSVFDEPWARETGLRAIAILPGLSPSRPHFTLLMLWRGRTPTLSEAELWAMSLATGVLARLPIAS